MLKKAGKKKARAFNTRTPVNNYNISKPNMFSAELK